MKINNRIFIYPIIILGFLFMLTSSCKKVEENPINQTNGKTTAVFNPDLIYGTLTDQDGNIYKTITIGTQTWMAENMRTTHYRNGDAIENKWSTQKTGLYTYYAFELSDVNIATYGRLYNWYAVNDSRNLAPIGWHVPTYAEWKTLTNYLGGLSLASGKLKEKSTTHWASPNNNANNETGFTAIPGGYCDEIGSFHCLNVDGYWWSSSESDTDQAWYIWLDNEISGNITDLYKYKGFSVRCLKD